METSKIIQTGVKAAAKETVKGNATEIASAVFKSEAGRKTATTVINATRNVAGKPSIYGGAARNVASAGLKKAGQSGVKMTPGGAAVTAAVSFGPDVYRYMNGKISGKELTKRTAGNAGSLGGSLYGATLGAPLGPAGVIGGTILGAVVGEKALKSFISIFL